MIIQGSNEPIILTIPEDMRGIDKFSAVLFLKNRYSTLKHWSKDDVTITDITDNDGVQSTNIIMPLTEQETMKFAYGDAVIQVKWLTDGNIYFASEIPEKVVKWHDKTRLIDGE